MNENKYIILFYIEAYTCIIMYTLRSDVLRGDMHFLLFSDHVISGKYYFHCLIRQFNLYEKNKPKEGRDIQI